MSEKRLELSNEQLAEKLGLKDARIVAISKRIDSVGKFQAWWITYIEGKLDEIDYMKGEGDLLESK